MRNGLGKGEIDRIGERIRSTSTIDANDVANLQVVRADYFEALRKAEASLREALPDYPLTSRLKTVQTIVEKLRREREMRLSRMQDIAGLRIVADLTLAQQDAAATIVAATFADSRIVDRRSSPSHGYRALHVYASADGLPVEIQIRTLLQDRWAQIVERLADRWGRQIRYGSGPRIGEGRQASARRMWDLTVRMSPLIAGCEEANVPEIGPAAPAIDTSFFCGQVAALLRQLAIQAQTVGTI